MWNIAARLHPAKGKTLENTPDHEQEGWKGKRKEKGGIKKKKERKEKKRKEKKRKEKKRKERKERKRKRKGSQSGGE
jgi:hypothetical protein